jgi:hypothetical protein
VLWAPSRVETHIFWTAECFSLTVQHEPSDEYCPLQLIYFSTIIYHAQQTWNILMNVESSVSLVFPWRNSQNQAQTASMLRFLDHTAGIFERLSARHGWHYLHNTQHKQETNVHVFSGIAIGNPSNIEAANLRHRSHGQRDGSQCLVLCPTSFLVGDTRTVEG